MSEVSGIEAAVQGAVDGGLIPGAVLSFGRRSGARYSAAFGAAALLPEHRPMATTTLFDVASLTKVLATTVLAMRLCERGVLDLDAPLGDSRPGKYEAHLAGLSPRLLLVHAAGLPPHVPFYADLPPEPDDPDAGRRQVYELVHRTPLAYAPGTESRYSDLGMILLGEFIEALGGTRLDQLFEAEVARPLGLTDTFFRHLDSPLARAVRPDEAFASTERCGWRNRVVVGQVHDENAYLLRGVAGHAGLFSGAADLEKLAIMHLDALAGQSAYLRRTIVEDFTTRQDVVPGSGRALGWGAAASGASCGDHLSSRAFGHTGFTGTSIWIDPEGERYAILLTNRVHPSRQDTGFLAFRPRLHDQVFAALDRG